MPKGCKSCNLRRKANLAARFLQHPPLFLSILAPFQLASMASLSRSSPICSVLCPFLPHFLHPANLQTMRSEPQEFAFPLLCLVSSLPLLAVVLGFDHLRNRYKP